MKILRLLLLPVLIVSEQMRGISLFGLETEHRGFMCDWKKPIDFYIDQLSKLNFNYFRVPFSYQYVKEGNLGQMDHFIDLAGLYNISVLLDFHRVWSNTQQPTPFDYGMSEQQFQDTWLFLLDRYKDKPQVVAHNAYNEYVPTDTDYLIGYTKRLFEKVEEHFPNRYDHYATGTLWSGNLRGVSLEDLPFKDRVYYSVHKYSFSGSANYEDWQNSFGSVGLPLDRVVVGEWGWIGTDPNQVDWAKRFIAYLKEKGITNTCYWALSQSGDTGNLYGNDCETFHWNNYELLKSLWGGKTSYRGLQDLSNNTSVDDDDDFDDRRNLQGRRRKCRSIENHDECIRHDNCCWGNLYGCWKCN